MKDLYQTLANRIQTSQKNVLCLHRRPDGDSIGSNLAFAGVLKKAGKEVDIYCIDEVPEYLAFLEGSGEIKVLAPDQIRWQNYDTFWALDMSAPDMLGKLVTFPPQLEIVVIDHHKTNENWGKVNLVDSSAVSCTQVLYEFFKAATIEIDSTIAMALLTGLATDTGFFKFIENGDPLHVGAELIDTYKLKYQTILYNIQQQLNIEDVLFVGAALSLITVNYEKKIALLPIPYTNWINFAPAGANNNHLLTGYISSINGTELGVIITEERPGSFRLNFRSRNRDFDVADIAKKLGGGGHKNASGATIQAESMDDAIAKLLVEIE